MIKNMVAAAVLCVLSVAVSPATAQTVQDGTNIGHEAEYNALVLGLGDYLMDPFTMVLRRLVFYPNGVVCGEVNGKNGFGAYSGFTGFIYDPTAVIPARRFWMEREVGEFLVRQRCNGAG